ncbi:MAG: hypothetical protein HOP21_00045 [Methylotenera sp.]|nr:hypothetical protein [Methylotenera sp.]
MDFLPKNSELGKLKLLEVFEFYDFPRIFTCKNSIGTLYFGLSVSETNDELEWLFAPASLERHNSIRSGNIDLRSAFTRVEDDFVYLVNTDKSHDYKTLERINVSRLKNEWLPIEGEKLNLHTHTVINQNETDPATVAHRELRETLNVIINPKNKNRTEAPARKLGSLLEAIQELLDALGQKINGNPTIKGAISSDILSATEVELALLFPGSIGLQLKAKNSCDLLGDSLAGEALQELLNLASARGDKDLLSNKLHSLRGRSASKYKLFLESISSLETDLKLDWGSPKEGRGQSINLSKTEILKALEIVSEINVEMADEIEIQSTLIGLNIRTMTYEILSAENEKFAGKISEEAKAEAANATINNRYIAKLKQLIEVQATTGEEKTRWLLTGLRLS